MIWPLLFAIGVIVALAAGSVALWLYAHLKSFRSQHEADQKKIEKLTQENFDLVKEVERTDATRQQVEKQFSEAQNQARQAFESLAGKVLKSSNEQFLTLARKAFDGEQQEATAELDKRKIAIENLVKPINEKLIKFSESVQKIEHERKEDHGGLRQQMSSLLQSQQDLRSETANLVKALRRPEVRGRWGEIQLKRVVELAGMIDHCDFHEQVHTGSHDRNLRPDMVVHLPGKGSIVVDAGTQLDAYLSALEVEDEQHRQECLDNHVRHIETKVNRLAAKAYVDQFERAPAFVVLFIPGESFLQAAAQRKPQIIETAWNRNVLIATPTTLISLLKAVALGWQEQRLADSARGIGELGKELHARISIVAAHVNRLGNNLDQAVQSYNRFVASFESRVVTSARKLKDLGADSPKELPAEGGIKTIEVHSRELKSSTD